MNLETFFEKFDQFAEAPDAVEKVRELVRNFAVTGKLVLQDPNDEPAEALVARIAAALPGKKSENPFLEEIEYSVLDESEYKLPPGWAWLPLGHVGIWATGCGFPMQYQGKTDGDFLFCKVSDMNLPGNEVEIHTTVHSIDADVMKTIRARANPVGTVIFPKIGGAIATHKRRLVIKPTIIDNNCSGIQPIGLTDDRWLLLLMRTLDLTKYQSGTSVPAVSQSSLDPVRIGLPPLAEQKRIVAKVDHLMALCDRLEAQQKEREARHATLARAALARFADAPTPANLPFLFHPSYDIPPSDLRKSILTLAVQGKLVPQDPNDEPAEQLFAKIQTRRAEMQSASRIPKPESQVSRHDRCEETLPYSWKQVRIGDLCLSIVPQRDKPLSFTGDIPWVTLPAFKENSVSLELGPDCEGLTRDEVEKYRLRIVPAGSVLMSCIGRFGLVALLDRDVVPNQQIHGFYFPTELLDGHFLCYSIMAQKTFLEAQSTMTTIAYLNKTKCESVPIALPPLDEQRRIAAKVAQLMVLVDDLESRLVTARIVGTELLDALVEELAPRRALT